MNDYELIIKKLTEQIAQLSKESAMYYALSVKTKEENKKLQEEIEKLTSETE